jgi:hypothetical protein
MSPYINHLTLATGDNRRSPRAEVGDDTLAALVPWLDSLTSAPGVRLPLPVASLSHYAATATVEAGALLCTVWAPAGPFQPGRPAPGEGLPIVTFGVAQRSRHGAALWALLARQFAVRPGLQRPSEPWCAVVLLPAALHYPDAMGWLGDFERCVAWAWISRAPQMGVAGEE